MSINDRVKEIRKCDRVNLTMEEFGRRLGVNKSAISRIENGTNNVSNSMTLSICREFGVSEEWLRTGDGEMFGDRSEKEQIEAFLKDVKVDEGFKSRFVSMLAQFGPDDWKALEEVVQSIIEKYKGSEPAADQTAMTTEELEEQYKKEVLGTAAKTASSASNTTDGTATAAG